MHLYRGSSTARFYFSGPVVLTGFVPGDYGASTTPDGDWFDADSVVQESNTQLRVHFSSFLGGGSSDGAVIANSSGGLRDAHSNAPVPSGSLVPPAFTYQ